MIMITTKQVRTNNKPKLKLSSIICFVMLRLSINVNIYIFLRCKYEQKFK